MESIADDMLFGAAAISAFIFGSQKKKRRIYMLAPDWPVFHMRGQLCARKSTLLRHFAEQENAGRTAARDSTTAEAAPVTTTS